MNNNGDEGINEVLDVTPFLREKISRYKKNQNMMDIRQTKD